MLAEIFFLRLETMLRAATEADRAKNCRSIPLPDNVFPALREKQASAGAQTVNG
ncbi:MAG TPA: hypothetical protein VKC66_06805 [Xanthobacteraceae bacterium]|nr:hypothetical protein [Xanthobacteraceae bacterium]